MARFLVRRLLNYAVLCVLATFLAYSLASITFAPLSTLQQRQPPPPMSTIAAKSAELHLDQPIPQRFLTWASGVVTGDFGDTVVSAPIADQVFTRAGTSLRLFLAGTIIGVALGVLVGVASAIRQYTLSDHVVTLLSFVLLATPVFVLGTLIKVAWLPVNQAAGTQILYFTGEVTAGFQGGFAASLLDRLQHLVLPTVAIALGQIALLQPLPAQRDARRTG